MNRKKWGKVGHLKDPLTKTVFILMCWLYFVSQAEYWQLMAFEPYIYE